MQPKPSDIHDFVEERAAIIEEGCGVSRAEAQDRAAKRYGFKNWAEYVEKTKGA